MIQPIKPSDAKKIVDDSATVQDVNKEVNKVNEGIVRQSKRGYNKTYIDIDNPKLEAVVISVFEEAGYEIQGSHIIW
jgi:hypothetical protein